MKEPEIFGCDRCGTKSRGDGPRLLPKGWVLVRGLPGVVPHLCEPCAREVVRQLLEPVPAPVVINDGTISWKGNRWERALTLTAAVGRIVEEIVSVEQVRPVTFDPISGVPSDPDEPKKFEMGDRACIHGCNYAAGDDGRCPLHPWTGV